MVTPPGPWQSPPIISELKIGNFKAFGPAQTIPLRPITLVFAVGLFYVLRLFAYFVVPGWLLLRMIGVVGNVLRAAR